MSKRNSGLSKTPVSVVSPQAKDKERSTPRRIAMYVIYDKDGILDGFRKYYLQELRKVTDHIVAIVCGSITPDSRRELEKLSDEILVRENKGLLAYAWIEGIEFIGWDTLAEYDELLMLNDSFFGPFYPLQDMFDACEKSDADFYGAFKNYEETAITESGGHQFKHGHLRGSICYFYIIKERLLHSPEFKRYWSQKPEIKTDFDTFFFNEFDFYDYVVDAGFKVDAYQSDKFKGYIFDNLTHNMEALIREDKIPFARMRAFGTDMKYQSLLMNYGKDPRYTLDYVKNNTDYDTDMIWDYILRTKNLTNIWNQMQLEYVVPTHSIEKPFKYDKKIAVILHIYYDDLVEHIANYCANFPEKTDFFVTTTTEKTYDVIMKEFSKRGFNFECQIRPNVGVAMSSLWVTYADKVTSGEYEYMCYFHDKKSPYMQYSITGEQFGERCYENLFGTKEVVENIINLFEEENKLGVLGAPMVYHANYFASSSRCWPVNYDKTVELAKTLDLHVDINPQISPVAPYGDMFWFRSDAMKKAIGHGFTYDDFDVPYAPDGTFMHAMERIYGFCAQDSGYYYADVIHTDNARADLVNYQYMLYHLTDIMISNGHYPHNYEMAKETLQQYKGVPLDFKHTLKTKIKAKIPRWIWEIARGIYKLFGGKKWVG